VMAKSAVSWLSEAVVDGRETLQHDLFELSTEIQRNSHPISITAINSEIQVTSMNTSLAA
ncbi:hypothetical protein, partial [Mycobacterium sp. AZCC_0083]|uniref:hypothetical protein n=1 Tax=Mycobacterium sp. AZCC_0083 TaxID=2735882 RepID=UPI001C865D71